MFKCIRWHRISVEHVVCCHITGHLGLGRREEAHEELSLVWPSESAFRKASANQRNRTGRDLVPNVEASHDLAIAPSGASASRHPFIPPEFEVMSVTTALRWVGTEAAGYHMHDRLGEALSRVATTWRIQAPDLWRFCMLVRDLPDEWIPTFQFFFCPGHLQMPWSLSSSH